MEINYSSLQSSPTVKSLSRSLRCKNNKINVEQCIDGSLEECLLMEDVCCSDVEEVVIIRLYSIIRMDESSWY